MRDTHLNILLIEDNPGDARLIKEILREAGTADMDVEWETRLSSGLSRLQQGSISAVLLDLGLPDATGLETVTKVCSRFPEIPVVVLTGQGEEAVAVQAVKRGAQDYLVKGAVDTMVLVRSIRYAIERKQMEVALVKARDELEKRVEERTSELLTTNRMLQLEIAERQRAGEALKQSEERFRAIFEGAQDLIFLKDLSLRYTHVNPAVEKLLGLPSSRIVGQTYEDLFDGEGSTCIKDADERVLEGKSIEDEHTNMVNGMPMTFLNSRIPFRNSEGQVVGILVVSRDITERKRSEFSPLECDTAYTSKAMRSTLSLANVAGQNDSTILLLGESGSGKDYLAKYIHNCSKRSSGPYFSVTCASIAASLAESELFGHEKGSFTGAHGRKRGLLELAEGGTLLLNEIGELPLTLQAKLLAFLDTKKFTRVGGEKETSVNVRLLTATNRDLEKEVETGAFRKDLFYRINVMSISVPPLRERREDIPILVQEILSQLSQELQITSLPSIDSAIMERLRKYDWPGNVRELRNVLERAVILSGGKTVNLNNLGLPRETERLDEDWSFTTSFPADQSLNQITQDLKRSIINEALRRSRGRRQAAARLLKISRDSLKHYMKTLGYFEQE